MMRIELYSRFEGDAVMKMNSSRRDFLSAGVAVPVAGLWSLADKKKPEAQAPPAVPAVKLQYRTLGKTGLKVTTVGFGCMITSDPSVIERAADLGVGYFDTARGYQGGNNERMVGGALKRKRKDVVLSTKSGAGGKEGALRDLETSLRELGTDYVDIWYLHGKDALSEVRDELIEAQQVAKQQGKIRFAGLSTHEPRLLIPFLIEKRAIDVVLVTYNFTMDQTMEAAIEQANNAGMGVVGMKVMAGGFRKTKQSDPLYSKLKTEGTMLAALKWVIRNPHVQTTIPSMTDMDQLDENLRAMKEPFAAGDEKLLARQLDFITPLYCRMCGECKGTCAQDLPVASILRHLTYADGYGQYALGRDEFLKLGSEVASARCGDCTSCTVHCPYGVQVSSRMTRAQELFA
jgi:predicted aldo/keto reductase-like oxidoreductase